MTLRLIPAVCFLAPLLLLGSSVQAVERDGPWIVNDWPAARKEARAASRPIFVVFR